MVQARSSAKLFFGFFYLVCATFLLGPSAAAQEETVQGWSVCNQTSYVQEVAVGRPDGPSVIVAGWSTIKPGNCQLVLPAPLSPSVHFLYARSSAAHRGGRREWAGDQTLCVDVTGSFSVESPPNCTAMGLEQKEFQPVLIEDDTSWRTNLRETTNYNLERARAAGVQRLLDDAGVFSGKIDGLIGRKTRAAIGDFLDQNGLPGDVSDEDLIDILEQVAKDKARNVGLTLCNRTDERIWAAIARQRTEGWESRGWWLLEAGGCARTIDRELLLVPHFVYGEIELPHGVRKPLRGSDDFCVGRSQFAIQGRADCEVSAYRSEKFVSTPAPDGGKIVFEFFERDFGPVEKGW